MRRVLTDSLPTRDKRVLVSKDEAKHLTRVLRMESGDLIEVLDRRGNGVVGKLEVEGSHVYLKFHEALKTNEKTQRSESLPIAVACAILKGDAMHFALEKATELGVLEFMPLLAERTVVKLESKDPAHYQTRWQKISDQSLKQCGRLEQMSITPVVSLDQVLKDENTSRVWFFMDEQLDGKSALTFLDELDSIYKDSKQNFGILIGPEGGWSSQERDAAITSKNVRAVSLSPIVLRAETALMSSVSILGAFLRSKIKKEKI